MKHLLFLLSTLSFQVISQAQLVKLGDKVEGGIVFSLKNKSHGLVVTEKEVGLMSWNDGKVACDTLNINGFSDWRLPTKGELAGIFYVLFIKRVVNFPSGDYWSRVENKGIKTLAWSLDFKDATESNTHAKSNKHYILAVRSF